jgi:hypothetical protein
MRFLPCLLVALLACAEGQKPASEGGARGPSARQLFPLAVGNRWSYRVTFLGASQDLTVSIVSEDEQVFVDSRGVRFHTGPDGLRDAQRYMLREPIAVGKQWSAVIDITQTESYRVTEVGASAEVPAGTFGGCVRVEASTAETPAHVLIAEQTYCPNVGLVRVVTYAEIDGRRGPPQVTQDLVSFKVQP